MNSDAYNRFTRAVMRGKLSTPRGQTVNMQLNETLYYTPMAVMNRVGGNPAIGMIEGLQFLAGSFNVDAIKRVAPHARLDLFGKQSAYGLRVGNQFHKIIDELSKDPWSRRAVLHISNQDDEPGDTPCTVFMQFQLMETSEGRSLASTAFMRSSDIIWGLPYDMIQFSIVTTAIARCLQAKVGPCAISTANAHYYRNAVYTSVVFEDAGWIDLPLWPEGRATDIDAYQRWAGEMVNAVQNREDLYTALSYTKP